MSCIFRLCTFMPYKFWSVIFMSCNFRPCILVLHFYVLQIHALQKCLKKLKSVSGSATYGLASPAFGIRISCSNICRATIYCQPQECSPGNVVSGSIRFMQIFAAVPWGGGVKWECGRWKWRFSLLLFTVFLTFYIHGHTTAFRWYDCQWPWRYLKVVGLFHIKFLINRLSFPRPFQQSLSCFRVARSPSNSWASCDLKLLLVLTNQMCPSSWLLYMF